jgi:hypothetical protein
MPLIRKWRFYEAKEGDATRPGKSTKKGGEGVLLKEDIIPKIKELGLRPPLYLKTYFTEKSSSPLDTSLRGGKEVFTPGVPIKEEFEWYIDKDWNLKAF